jgi:hypothetical protein
MRKREEIVHALRCDKPAGITAKEEEKALKAARNYASRFYLAGYPIRMSLVKNRILHLYFEKKAERPELTMDEFAKTMNLNMVFVDGAAVEYLKSLLLEEHEDISDFVSLFFRAKVVSFLWHHPYYENILNGRENVTSILYTEVYSNLLRCAKAGRHVNFRMLEREFESAVQEEIGRAYLPLTMGRYNVGEYYRVCARLNEGYTQQNFDRIRKELGLSWEKMNAYANLYEIDANGIFPIDYAEPGEDGVYVFDIPDNQESEESELLWKVFRKHQDPRDRYIIRHLIRTGKKHFRNAELESHGITRRYLSAVIRELEEELR